VKHTTSQYCYDALFRWLCSYFLLFALLLLVPIHVFGVELTNEERGILREAVDLAREGDVEKGLQILDQLARTNPGSRTITFDRIVLLAWAGRDLDAVFLYEYAIAYPDELPGYVAQSLAGSYRRLGNLEGMKSILDFLKEEDPDARETQLILASYREAKGQPARALAIYNKWYKENPDDEEALDGRLRTLLQISATRPVLKEIESGALVHPSIRLQALSEQAAFHLRSGQLRRADVLLRRNESLAISLLTKTEGQERQLVEDLLGRTIVDRILLEEERDNPKGIIKLYRHYNERGMEFPVVVRLILAGAYLSEKEPEEALSHYKAVYHDLKREGVEAEFSEEGIQAQMGIYWCHMEMGQGRKARERLAYLENNVSPFVHWLMDNQPVWERMSIDLEYGWWLLYQNRLLPSEKHFRSVLQRAPRNSSPWASLGANLRAQGRIREAVQSLEMAVLLDPENAGARVGLSLAYADLGRLDESERILSELQRTRYAANSNVINLEKELSKRKSPELSGSFLNDEYYSIGARVPLTGRWAMEAQRIWQDKARDRFFFDTVGLSEEQISPLASTNRVRWYLGAQGNYGLAGQVRAAATYEEKLGTPGAVLQYEYPLTDRIRLTGGVDTNSPAAPVVGEVKGWDGYGIASIRFGNRWTAYAGSGYLNLNDDNDRWEGYVGQSMALYLDQSTFLNLAIDANYTSWGFESPNYYSVTSIFTGYLPLILRHAFYQRQENRFGVELAAGPGYKWEKDFDGGFIWFVRGQMEFDFNHWLTVLIGSSHNLNRYSGQDEYQTNVYGSLSLFF